MRHLLAKEVRLCMHPAAIVFLFLSSMVMIPNYPYLVAFFYTTLGIFFICLSGRENNDIFFSVCLPVKKTDIVTARFITAVALELVQVILAAVFVIIRNALGTGANLAGMDANISLFGWALIMLGVFNLVFFTAYYKNVAKVGSAFVKGCIVTFVIILFVEATVHFLPFMKDVLDTPDPEHQAAKLILLGAGIVLYVVLTATAHARAKRSFEKFDL